MHPTIYHCMNRVWTREELCADADADAEAEIEPARLYPDQWVGAKFIFDDWLSESLLTGYVERVWPWKTRTKCPVFHRTCCVSCIHEQRVSGLRRCG